MDRERTRQVFRNINATLTLLMVAFAIPAVIYHYVFKLPPSEAPHAKVALGVALGLLWLSFSTWEFATPTGKPWRWPVRAAVMVGGYLLAILAMWIAS